MLPLPLQASLAQPASGAGVSLLPHTQGEREAERQASKGRDPASFIRSRESAFMMLLMHLPALLVHSRLQSAPMMLRARDERLLLPPPLLLR